MKRTIGYHMAAILGATMLASPALAQGGTEEPGLGISPEAGVEAGADTTMDGADADFDSQGTADIDSDWESEGTAEMETEWEGEGTADVAPAGPADVTTGSIGSAATQADAVTAIQSNAENAAALGAMTEVDTVEVVRVDELDGYDDAEIEQALAETPGALEELQVSVESNPELATELEALGVAPNSVIATQTSADGQLTVFVR